MGDKTIMCKGDNKMKKLFFGTLLLALVIAVPIPTMARISIGINIGIPLPPLIVFESPPEVVVIPETNVYADPDANVNLYFYDGWWWRHWEGRWYRSRDYSSGWIYYRNTPSFYNGIPSGWRSAYRQHRYKGNEWNSQRIPQQQLQQNWSTWKKNRYWEKQNTWGVQGLKSRTRSQQRSQEVQKATTSQQSRSKSGEVQQQKTQPQDQKATQKSKTRDEKSDKGEGERRDSE